MQDKLKQLLKMKIYKSTEDVDFLKNGILFLDNNALVAIINNEVDFAPFLKTIIDNQCILMIIPSIGFEFSRTDSIKDYSRRNEFIKEYLTVYPIERYMEKQIAKLKEYIFVIQNIMGKISYSDFLLYCCLYLFPINGFVMTEDHHHFSTILLERKILLTTDDDRETIRNLAIYGFNKTKYEKAAQNILRHK